MFTSRSFEKKFGRRSKKGGRGYTPLWPWQACFFSIFGLTVAILITALILTLGNVWKVSSVQVQGTVRYDADVIAEASDIQAGESMMSFDKQGLETLLKEHYPLIRSVRIQRRLNGKVILSIVEETEIYYTCHHSNYDLISAADLTVLGVASNGIEYKNYGAVYLGLPEEARIRVGEKVIFDFLPYEPVSEPEQLATYEIETQKAEKEYAYVWTFTETVEASAMAGRITGMELGDKYDLYLVFDGHIKIRFGNMDDLERKVSQAVEILAKEIDGSDIPAEIDVSNPKKSTFRENSDLILPDWARS